MGTVIDLAAAAAERGYRLRGTPRGVAQYPVSTRDAEAQAIARLRHRLTQMPTDSWIRSEAERACRHAARSGSGVAQSIQAGVQRARELIIEGDGPGGAA